jgi:hypothetical protein
VIGHSVRSEAEWLLLRRARDGELARVGGVYLHRGRDYATKPIEELVVAGSLADPDPGAEAIRLALTDAGRERFAPAPAHGGDAPPPTSAADALV